MAAAWSARAKFLVVKAELDRIDTYDLLASGAPKDEFDDEALAISQLISNTSSAQDIAETISAVLNNVFGLSDSASIYQPAAERIHAALQAI